MIESADDLYEAMAIHIGRMDTCPVCGSKMNRTNNMHPSIEKSCGECMLVLAITKDLIGVYEQASIRSTLIERDNPSKGWYEFVTRLQTSRNHD